MSHERPFHGAVKPSANRTRVISAPKIRPNAVKSPAVKGEIIRLDLVGKSLLGELALELPPGTTAAARDHAIDALLGPRLDALALQMTAVVAAAPSAFAFQEPGKDEQKRTRFTIRGLLEADRFLPQRPKKG